MPRRPATLRAAPARRPQTRSMTTAGDVSTKYRHGMVQAGPPSPDRAGTMRVQNLIRRVATWLMEAPPSRVLAVSVVVIAIRNGVWATPNVDAFMQVADNPTRTPPFDQRPGGDSLQESYLLSSPLGALLARAIHFHTHFLLFAVLHLAVLLLALYLLTKAVERHYGGQAAKLAIALFAAAPISTVTFTWLGQPDVFTLGFSSALVLSPSGVVAYLAAVGLGFNTFEQGAFILVLIALVQPIVQTSRRWPVWLPFVGLVLGKVILESYHAAFDIVQVANRARLLADIGVGNILEGLVRHWPVVLLSLYWVGWTFVVKIHRALLERGEVSSVRRLVIAQLLAVGGMATAFDYTRVHALLSWPVLLLMACWAATRLRDEEVAEVTAALAIGAVVPAVLVWGFGLYSTAYPAMYDWVSARL